MTRDEAKAYFTKLGTDAGLDESARNALQAALEKNETFAKAVTDGFMLHADYSRSKNEVAAEKRKAEEDYGRKYQELADWAKQHNQTIEQAKSVYDEYQRFKAAGLTVNGDPPLDDKKPQPVGLTLEDARKLLAEQAQATGNLVKFSAKFNQDYYKRFGEFPDIEEFDTFLGDQRKANPNLDVDSAYQKWVSPKIEERREAQFKEQLVKAREEGARDALSKVHMPLDNGKREMAPAWEPKRHELAKMNPEQQEENGKNEFFAGWNEAATAANSR